MEMMQLEKIVQDVVLLVIRSVDELESVGVESHSFYAKVIGYDEFGLWVEHPHFEVVYSEDEHGKPLPPHKVTRQTIPASLQIQWSNVATIVHFPNREGFDLPNPFSTHVGFELKKGQEKTKETKTD